MFIPETVIIPFALQYIKSQDTVHKIIILTFVLYGCETRSLEMKSLTVREEHKEQITKNIIPRKMFEPNITEV